MFSNSKVNVLLICGVSGSGKTFIRDILEKNSTKKLSFERMVQCTTRKPRSLEEIDLKVYDFITEEEYDRIKDNLIARTEVNGFRYGTINKFIKSSLGKTVVNTIIVNRKGYDDFKNYLKDKNYNVITVEITVKDEIKDRSDRNILQEQKELEGIADIKIDNSFGNRLDFDRIINTLKKAKFIK